MKKHVCILLIITSILQTFSKSNLLYCEPIKCNWYYNSFDNANIDNSGTVLVTSDGNRVKRFFTGRGVSVKSFGAKGDGVSNDQLAIQKALSNSGLTIYIPAGIYIVNNFIRVANNVNIIGEGSKSVIAATTDIPNDPIIKASHQGQIFILGNNCNIRNIKVDGRKHNAGGFCIVAVHNCSISNCTVVNGGSSQAILDCISSFTKYTNNTVVNCLSGVQLWMSDHCFISGNYTNNCSVGIWGANPSNVNCISNKIKNCDDVGLDWEGGQNIVNTKNTVSSCNNGEMSIFTNNTSKTGPEVNILFTNNNITRTADYMNRDGKTVPINPNAGAVQISSISAGCKNVVFNKNIIRVQSGYAFFTNDITVPNTEIYFTDNKILSSDKFFRVQGTDGLLIKNNYFKGLKNSENKSNEIKNAVSLVLQENTFVQDITKIDNPVLFWHTDRTLNGKKPILIKNKFVNTADLALKHDPYVSGLPCILEANIFTDNYTANGGVTSTVSGVPIYINQNLKIKNTTGVRNILMNTTQ